MLFWPKKKKKRKKLLILFYFFLIFGLVFAVSVALNKLLQNCQENICLQRKEMNFVVSFKNNKKNFILH